MPISTYPMKILARINHSIMIIGSLLLGLMVIHTTFDVAMTYIAGLPVEGTVEIVSRYYMVAVVFLPLAFVTATDKHIVAELLSDRLTKRMQLACQCLAWILMAAFGAALAWQCGLEAMRMTAINEQFQTSTYFIPTWPSRWIPVFSGVLIAVQALALLALDITRLWHWKEEDLQFTEDPLQISKSDAASQAISFTAGTST